MNGDIEWDFSSDGHLEYLTTNVKVTDKKEIGIKITYNGSNYYVEFYYLNNQIEQYYYQQYVMIFDLFIYAKYINYIKILGNNGFIDFLVSNYDIFKWLSFGLYFQANLGNAKYNESTIEVWEGGIDIILDDEKIYTIRDTKLFNKLIKNIN